jgi:DMSO/TMAO reductase YedYZ molybdopterin-dependent catalytic subunit
MAHRNRRTAPGNPVARGPLWGGVLGVAVTAVSLGAGQLVAAIVGPSFSPVYAVGGAAIDASPRWLKSFAIRTFGTNDKTALLIGIATILAIVAIALGIFALRRPVVGLVGLVAFGALGVVAAMSRPDAGQLAVLPSILGVAAGWAALRFLTGPRIQLRRQPVRRARTGPATDPTGPPGPPSLDRRRFLIGSATLGVSAVAVGLGGRVIASHRFAAVASRATVRIPRPASPATAIPTGADLHVPGLSSFVTPVETFYRIDTALIVPSVPASTWRLRIHGMVDRPVEMDFAQLLRRPLIERDVTLTCVSNEVGGVYVGNARWIGARLKDVLDEAGVHAGATQLVSRSADGMTIGSPTAIVMDGRDAMLAVAMNGQPLPLAHGFPVRMVVPGLYGYVSATKWVVDMELTTFQAFDPYWVARGWARPGPIKVESRIDTPRSRAAVPTGRVPVAGVAWAQHRGIERVEVRVDQGPWNEARLADQDSVDTWRQWVYVWDAKPGSHTLQVRAMDDTGAVQTAKPADPFPSGATGYHTIPVTVT